MHAGTVRIHGEDFVDPKMKFRVLSLALVLQTYETAISGPLPSNSNFTPKKHHKIEALTALMASFAETRANKKLRFLFYAIRFFYGPGFSQ